MKAGLQIPEVKKELYGLAKFAAAKSMNLSSLFHAYDTYGKTGRVENADYQKAVRQINPAIGEALIDQLFTCFETEEKGRVYLDYNSFIREVERYGRARDTVFDLCKKLSLVVAERKQTATDYLKSIDSNELGFISFDELERLAKDLKVPLEAAQIVAVFDILNDFGTDVKIQFTEFEKVYKEYGPGAAESVAVHTPRDDKVDAIAEEKLIKLVPTFARLKQLLVAQHLSTFKSFLDKHCKSENGLIAPDDFLRSLRLLSPSLNLPEAKALLEICQVDQHVRADRLDEVHKRAKRFGKSDQGRLG